LKKYIRGCVSFKKYNFQGKTAEVTVNTKEENSYFFTLMQPLDFVQEFDLMIDTVNIWGIEKIREERKRRCRH
jgi:hypothetical protein